MEQQIRFCTASDGIRIAYATVGQGPALVMVPGWVSHLELDWQLPAARAAVEALAREFTVIRLDKRGTGLSDRGVGDYSLEARLRDLEAVVEHLKLRTFSLSGVSEGGPTCIAYAARHPKRIAAMVLYGTFARGRGIGGSPELIDAIKSVVKAEWGMGSRLLTDLFVGEGAPEMAMAFTIYQRAGVTPEDAYAMLEATVAIDVTDLLLRVKAPALVVHARDDRVAPIDMGREIAAGIPHARFASVSGSHVTGMADPERYRATMAFLLEHAVAVGGTRPDRLPPSPAAVHTILFTDIEGSTAMTQRLGDVKARDVLREHERITRECLRAHGGSEVKTMGDGFMASFGSATKALECAIAIQRSFDERNASLPAHPEEPRSPSAEGRRGVSKGRAEHDAAIKVRIGLNAGEPIAEDEDLFGTAVIRAARIAALAEGGEILAANVVRELAEGKGFLFGDRGDVPLRGFDDPVRLFEVRWQPFDSPADAALGGSG